MKFIAAYKNYLNCSNEDEVFEYLLNNLKPTIKGWDYFVNWKKVVDGYKEYKNELDLFSSLVGESDIESSALSLISDNPEVKKVIPLLLACRDINIDILDECKGGFKYKNFAFNESLQPEDAVLFLSKSGLLKFLGDGNINSVSDYVAGVQSGLDSNARKNRGGSSMENIVKHYISALCEKNDWQWSEQVTSGKIKKLWNKDITVTKANRIIDFAIFANKKLYLIEVNFYGVGGSKLKSTAGEYKSDFSRWSNDGHRFVWITDGAGWKTAKKPIRETFDQTEYILNLDMLERGMLEFIIAQ